MKKAITWIMSISLAFTLAACGSQSNGSSAAESIQETSRQSGGESAEEPSEEQTEVSLGNEESEEISPGNEESEEISPENEESEEASPGNEETAEVSSGDSGAEPETEGGKTLVVYFSASGNTEAVAGYIADAADAETFELVPVNPYSADDLDWRDENSRVVYEHDNPDDRVVELVETAVSDWDSYDTVFIGYPIWWEIAAWPVESFVAANDFTGKTVIPFCTSANSEIGESGELLEEMAGTGNWLDGGRFSSDDSEEDIKIWVDSFGLGKQVQEPVRLKGEAE